MTRESDLRQRCHVPRHGDNWHQSHDHHQRSCCPQNHDPCAVRSRAPSTFDKSVCYGLRDNTLSIISSRGQMQFSCQTRHRFFISIEQLGGGSCWRQCEGSSGLLTISSPRCCPHIDWLSPRSQQCRTELETYCQYRLRYYLIWIRE